MRTTDGDGRDDTGSPAADFDGPADDDLGGFGTGDGEDYPTIPEYPGHAGDERRGGHGEVLEPEPDHVPDYVIDGVVDGDVAVPGALEGDVNGDGVVDAGDLDEPMSPFEFESRDFQAGGLFDRP